MKLSFIRVFPILIILCLGIIVYSNTFHASFQFDDRPSITDNDAIRHIQNIQGIWSFWPCRFLTYLSIALDFHFHQLDVPGYHVLNLMVHLSTALMVCWFVLLTLSTPVMKGNRITPYANKVALFAGLVFVSHPVQTEAVTYIVQRATSLATLFYLASICFYAKARLLQESRSNSGRQYYIFALIAAVMAMFTKEMTITLPLMLWLYEASFFKAEKNLKWKNLTPFLLTIVIIPLTMLLTKYVDFHHLRRAGEQPQDIDSIHYLLTQFRVLVTYIRLDFFPLDQNFDYDYPVSKSIFELGTFSSLLLLIGILYAAKRLFKDYRLLSFSIFWFFLTLLPESSVIPIRDVIFEHRLYLPLVGYSIFLAGGTFYLFRKRSFTATGMVLTLIIGINSFLTYERNKVWQDKFHLWDDVVHKSPHKERPYNNLGLSNDNKGNFAEALRDYKKAMEINPYDPELYFNSGVVYGELGATAQALAEYNKAIQLDPQRADAYSNRAVIFASQGNYTQALADYTQAIKADPYMAVFYLNRGNAYNRQGRLTDALADYGKAIELNPDYAVAYDNLAVTYYQLKEYGKAWESVRRLEKLPGPYDPQRISLIKQVLSGKK